MSLRASDGVSAAEAQLYLREEPMRQSFEAFLLAWHALNEACEPLLTEHGLGAAHHRVLFLVGSHDHITPTELLDRLGITKQSLGRALNDLKSLQLLEQKEDSTDRRRKPLCLTDHGRAVEAALFQRIRHIMTHSYRQADGKGVEGFRRILTAMHHHSIP